MLCAITMGCSNLVIGHTFGVSSIRLKQPGNLKLVTDTWQATTARQVLQTNNQACKIEPALLLSHILNQEAVFMTSRMLN